MRKSRTNTPFIFFLYVLALSTTTQLFPAAEKAPKKEEVQIFGTHRAAKKVLDGFLARMCDEQQGTVHAEIAHLTARDTIDRLTRAADRGVKVLLRLDEKNHKTAAAQEAIAQLQKAGASVTLVHDTHAKLWLVTLPNGKTVLCIKSSNESNNALNNDEDGCGTGDVEVCAAAREFLDNPPQKPDSNRESLSATPKKQLLIHSYQTNLNGTRAQRIENAAKAKKADPTVPVSITGSSMNINDESVVTALCNAAQEGVNVTLYLDKTTVNAAKQDILHKCDTAGVKIFVSDPDKSHTMHAKLLLRSIGADDSTNPGDVLEVSSGNWTKEGDAQRNYSLYVPQPSVATAGEVRTIFKKIERRSVPFASLNGNIYSKKRKKAENPSEALPPVDPLSVNESKMNENKENAEPAAEKLKSVAKKLKLGEE